MIKRTITIEKEFLEAYCLYDTLEIADCLLDKYKENNEIIIMDMTEKNHPQIWARESFKKNRLHLEQLIYSTKTGVKVRSKSELIIANQLELNDIPFRYEAALSLDESEYYPDFTILNPRDNQIIYWEHFGMMDNPNYGINGIEAVCLL